ncbi:MAG: response regulator transcription factor [Bacteroidota bacterium]|nr:response regulator transcription factor [Bacteroidota bacterium]
MREKNIKLAIVDDEDLIVSLLQDFLIQEKDIEISIAANSGNEFLKKLESTTIKPDIVLMDMRMKDKDGIDTTLEMKKKYPNIKVITISSYYKKSFMGFMMRSGVSAFIPKSISPEALINVIHEVNQKSYYFMPEQVEIMRKQISNKSPKPELKSKMLDLSERENEVLKLICEENTAQEIAVKLCVSKRTIDGHRNNLLVKTGAKNTAGLVMYALKNGIIDMGAEHFLNS